MTQQERIKKLVESGHKDFTKWLTIDDVKQLDAGTELSIAYNDKAHNIMFEKIKDAIKENGYVSNTKLHRRWVMAQMFRRLKYVGPSGEGYTASIKDTPYKYSIKQLLEEIRVISEIQKSGDDKTFRERASFFSSSVISSIMKDHSMKVYDHIIDNMKSYKCKGVEYRKVNGKDIFVSDLDKQYLAKMLEMCGKINAETDYSEIYRYAKKITKMLNVNLPDNTEKSKIWIEAYKGSGAYYTLLNLIKFHKCRVHITTDKEEVLDMEKSLNFVNNSRIEYVDNGWKMMGLLKKVITDNAFDFDKAMTEIYASK